MLSTVRTLGIAGLNSKLKGFEDELAKRREELREFLSHHSAKQTQRTLEANTAEVVQAKVASTGVMKAFKKNAEEQREQWLKMKYVVH